MGMCLVKLIVYNIYKNTGFKIFILEVLVRSTELVGSTLHVRHTHFDAHTHGAFLLTHFKVSFPTHSKLV